MCLLELISSKQVEYQLVGETASVGTGSIALTWHPRLVLRHFLPFNFNYISQSCSVELVWKIRQPFAVMGQEAESSEKARGRRLNDIFTRNVPEVTNYPPFLCTKSFVVKPKVTCI